MEEEVAAIDPPSLWDQDNLGYLHQRTASLPVDRIRFRGRSRQVGAASEKHDMIRSESAALCVNPLLATWRPIRLILTGEGLICQQGYRTLWWAPLERLTRAGVVEAKGPLGLRRRALLLEACGVRRLILVAHPEEWRSLLMPLRTVVPDANFVR